VGLNRRPEKSGKKSGKKRTSLDLVLPRSEERFPVKKNNYGEKTEISAEDIQK